MGLERLNPRFNPGRIIFEHVVAAEVLFLFLLLFLFLFGFYARRDV
jgi:hypothetical protein